jgi:hypothetical protein
MIEKKLDILGKYAEEIENEDPLHLLVRYFNLNQSKLQITEDKGIEIGKDFKNAVVQVISDYEEKGFPDKMILSHLFCIFISFVKKSMIEHKAIELDIDRTLYKNEMRFLFKGRWK